MIREVIYTMNNGEKYSESIENRETSEAAFIHICIYSRMDSNEFIAIDKDDRTILLRTSDISAISIMSEPIKEQIDDEKILDILKSKDNTIDSEGLKKLSEFKEVIILDSFHDTKGEQMMKLKYKENIYMVYYKN